ncbi:CamS family sex pheromone protein [Brevibacillus humidisoli]|uniref:CamS family sex pheromone protein n=1 Tax=Brevibacillus humidisoli TaxID=2895522 RepID=UPI001E608472|nr:CamS family sex pheromone protein [Brevibacillus humidisoli]UFJ41034.1 CamS family sex pheromone protein [Brevibacillus humidisoli]
MNKRVKVLFYFFLTIILLCTATACSLFPDGEEKPAPATPTVSPVIEVSGDYYGSVMPYKPNQTRGMLSRLSGYRIDFSHLELGLLEIARETFDPEEYLFQEGQQISSQQVRDWLAPASEENPKGLNPENGSTLLLHVLEHDYLDVENQQLAGMVLGLTLSPEYKDASGQEKVYSTDELRAKGQALAAKIVQQVRADNAQIPMVIALYQVPDHSSTMIPGNFIMTGTVNSGEGSVSKWQAIDEKYYLFPGDAVYKDYPQISLQYDKLMKQTKSFFSEFIGLTGVGRFMGRDLVELTLTATAEYDSRTEVIQFTQYCASQINQVFDKQVHVNLYVESINRPLAIYVRPANGEGYMHVYRK